jgi:hypothetical protein
MASSGMLHHVALVRTDVSGELSTSFIRVTRIGELGTTLAITSKWHSELSSPSIIRFIPTANQGDSRVFHPTDGGDMFP